MHVGHMASPLFQREKRTSLTACAYPPLLTFARLSNKPGSQAAFIQARRGHEQGS